MDEREVSVELKREGEDAPVLGAPVSELEEHRDLDQSDKDYLDWYHNVYQGDTVPQLTWRAIIMGGLLGSLMSISNLYTMIKVGWAFGVAITACVLSFVIWNALRIPFRKLTPMSILENTCMQSTASAAGYSTGSTIATAFGAYLLITGKHIGWQILLPFTLLTAALGVFMAVPMKRQMINREKLPFPDGIAAAETLRSLYSRSKESVQQAKALIGTLVVGAVVGIMRAGDFAFQKTLGLKLPDLYAFPYLFKGKEFPSFGFEPSVMLVAAGMIVGLRVSVSMLAGSCLLYFIIGPMLLQSGELQSPELLIKWSLWTGSALMVTSGLMALALQWKQVARSFSVLKPGGQKSTIEEIARLEVPSKWFLLGAIPLLILMALLQYVAFSIAIPLGVLSVLLSFFLALVACRSTGETNVTPIGAMGKVSQLIFAVLSPANATTNLMVASCTANIASSSADLLTDLKSGYLLGANPRKQFLAQLTGVVFGTLAIVPAWYLMIPDAKTLDAFHPPSTYVYKAVAEALSHGISYVPLTARWGMLIGGVLGIILASLEHFYPKTRKYLPSPMGLGLSWVMVFSNSVAFFIGAVISAIWLKVNKKSGEQFIIPAASGAIAGESLACAFIAMFQAVGPLLRALVH